MKPNRTLVPALVLCLLTPIMLAKGAFAADAKTPSTLIDELADDAKRASAIEQLLKLGAAADADLHKALNDKKLTDRQLILVRRLIGNILINRDQMKLVDASKLAPFGEDKANKVAGTPSILIEPDPAKREENKTIVMSGEFVLEQGPLEYLIVSKGPGAKLHETVLAIDARPHDMSYALLACEYAFAGEITEEGTVSLPKNSGVMMSVEFEWETPNITMGDAEAAEKAALEKEAAARQAAIAAGKQFAPDPAPVEAKVEEVKPNPYMRWVRMPLEEFAYNLQTENIMKRVPFAFTGSRIEKDPETGKMIFIADIERSIAAVRLDPNALLNSPLNTRNVNPLHANGYSVNWSVVPKRHSKCRLILEPYVGKELTDADLTDTGEKKAKA